MKRSRTGLHADPFAFGSPGEDRLYAVRFTVDVFSDILVIRSSTHLLPRRLRLRGIGSVGKAWINAHLVLQDIDFERFSDRFGGPYSPRRTHASEDDALDDSSDGPSIDWPCFGGQHDLHLSLVAKNVDQKLHLLMTVIGQDYPDVSFRYEGAESWNTATVVDYVNRIGHASSL